VVASEIYLAYCTDPGAVYIKEQMEKTQANRLVVGA
jgi:heterodisulfide reductase subunit A-like polyferredoxin